MKVSRDIPSALPSWTSQVSQQKALKGKWSLTWLSTWKGIRYSYCNAVLKGQDWYALWWGTGHTRPHWGTTVTQENQRRVCFQPAKGILYLMRKISQSKKSAVKNVIPDFNEKDKKLYPPETQPPLNTIKESDISNDSFNVGFMRPIPKFIDIHPSELNWLSPGIITDVHWDNSA